MTRTRLLKLAFAITLAVSLTAGGAAAASWTGYTQAVGVDAAGHTPTGATTALGADIAHHTGSQTPVVYAGDHAHVSRSGAAMLRRSAGTNGNHNLTLVGQQTGLAASYYSGVKDAQGDYVYSVRSLEGQSLSQLSEAAVTHHYTHAGTAVVANPQYVSDYAGGIANATKTGHPLLYASSKSQYKALNATLQRLGVQSVDYTKHVPSTVQTNLTADYTATKLPTGTGASYINTQDAANASGPLYVVNGIQNVPYVEQPANGHILVLPSSGGVGSTINSYLQAHHPRVDVVGNPSGVPKAEISAMAANTTQSVSRIGYATQQGLSTRLALKQLNSSNPLVSVGQTTTTTQNGTATVTVHVRNYGYTPAKNVQLHLAENKTATYNYTQTTPTSSNATSAAWTLSALPANGTATIQYQISGVTGKVQTVPSVTSYENGAGTSFHGAAFFNLGQWIKPARAQVLGLYQTITSLSPVTGQLSPLLIGGALAALIGLGLVAYYLTTQQTGGH